MELQQGAPTGPLFAEQVGDAIAMLLAKQYATVRVGLWGTGGSIPPARLKQVLDYVEAHLDQQTHLSELALRLTDVKLGRICFQANVVDRESDHFACAELGAGEQANDQVRSPLRQRTGLPQPRGGLLELGDLLG